MKKLLMFLFLMTISLGQSQTLVGTWKVTSIGVGESRGVTNYFSLSSTSGARACFFDDEYVFDADGDFHNVQQGETYLEGWQGPEGCGVPVAPHNGSNAATYSSTATTLTLTGVGAHLGLAKVITDSEISSPSAAPASVTYLLTSLTTTTLTVDVPLSNGAWWRFVLSNEVVAPPPPVAVPTVAAPTPTQAAGDVISVYSDAYSSVNVLTFRTDWSSAGAQENVTIAGNPTLKYNGLNYAGIDINPANQIDATSMENFHIDMWTPDCTVFRVKIVDFGPNGVYGGGDDREHEVTRTPVQNGWNSFDLSLSEFTGLTTRANINQFVLVSSGGTAYIDNMYFWKLPSGSQSYYVDADGDGYGAGVATVSTTPIVGSVTNNTDCAPTNAAINPGATEVADTVDNDCDGLIDEGFPPTIAATTPPARNAWDVVSIFSGAYSNVTLDELPTEWSQLATAPFSVETIAGNPTWKFGGEFLGMVTNYGSGVNLSDMTMVHIDYWTPDPNLIILKLVNTVDGGDGTAIVEDPTVSGSWRSRDIPLSTFGALNRSKITQLLIDPQSGGSTVYVDNFYFYRPATGAPSPSIGALTVPAKVIGDANFDLTAPSSNSAGAFTFSSSNESVATISGSTVTIVGAGSSIITATQAAAGAYGAGSTTATLVVSLATSAPAPTVPGDRVLSVFSGAAGYANVAGTNFYPNWGQSTQYALESIAGNSTLRYSNLNYQGIQLGSVIDISTYDTVHLNIYGAGTTAVDFRVINQVGGAGSPDVERVANRAITLTPGWNSIEFPVSALTTATPGFELNRVGQLMFVGSGTIYVDNIFFSKAVPTPVAPTVTDIAFCKGAVSALTAIASGTNALRWYSSATSTTVLASAPVATVTKTYSVAQIMSSGVVSPRAIITATVNSLPTEVLGAMTSTTAGTTPGTFAPATLKAGQYVGTTTPISYRIPAFIGGGLTYLWSVPASVTIVGASDTNVLTVHYNDVAPGAGSIGAIRVQAVNTNGCAGTAKSITVSKVLPTAPGPIKMTNAALPLPLSGVAAAITTFAPYMGKTTVLTLTAKPSLTATSYDWELPAGVTQLSGGNSNEITVNFAGVTSSNTYNYSTAAAVPVSTNVARIGVKSRNGVGVSVTSNAGLLDPTTTSTARLLTLKATRPGAPASLKMFNLAVSNTVVVTDISKFIGTTTELTLTAAVSKLASSYSWEIPSNVTVVAGSDLTSNSIKVTFANVPASTASLYLGVKAVNGIGSSVTNNAALTAPTTTSEAKLLKVTAKAPATPGTVVGSLKICASTSSSQTYTITTAAAGANTYTVTAPAGCTINGGTSNTASIAATAGATFTVNYPTAFIATTTVVKTIAIQSVNGFGGSVLNKVLKLTNTGATCAPKFANQSTASDFKVSAYPNPSSSEFTIESSAKGAMSVKVYDMQGRLVEKADTNRVGSKLATGTYNVIVNQGANTKSLRVIKR